MKHNILESLAEGRINCRLGPVARYDQRLAPFQYRHWFFAPRDLSVPGGYL
jgi:hypothetical protein